MESSHSFSSLGAEILAAADSADRSYLIIARVQFVCSAKSPLPLKVSVDLMGLGATTSTVHEGRDYPPRPVVLRLRDCYERGEIHSLMWIPGKCNIADALSNSNLENYRKLNEVLSWSILNSNLLKDFHVVSSQQD